MLHYAIRTLMFETAIDANVDPDPVSFVAAPRIERRGVSAARDSRPQTTDHAWRHVITLLCQRLNPPAANAPTRSGRTAVGDGGDA